MMGSGVRIPLAAPAPNWVIPKSAFLARSRASFSFGRFHLARFHLALGCARRRRRLGATSSRAEPIEHQISRSYSRFMPCCIMQDRYMLSCVTPHVYCVILFDSLLQSLTARARVESIPSCSARCAKLGDAVAATANPSTSAPRVFRVVVMMCLLPVCLPPSRHGAAP